jgi:predicted nucleotidyltransferase
MNIFFPEHKALLHHLLSGGVRFILVGGYAVVAHGYTRTTEDMDILLEPTNPNRDKLLQVFENQGYHPDDLMFIHQMDFSQPIAFHIGEKPLRVDFLTRISNVSFQEAWETSMLLPMDDTKIPVLQLHHLILSKITTGRHKDLADIEKLQAIQKKRSSENKS